MLLPPPPGPRGRGLSGHVWIESSLCWRQVTAGDDGQEKSQASGPTPRQPTRSRELIAPAGAGYDRSLPCSVPDRHSGGRMEGRACLADLSPSPLTCLQPGLGPSGKSRLPHPPRGCDLSRVPASLPGPVRLAMSRKAAPATGAGPVSVSTLLNECHAGASAPRCGSCRCRAVLLAEHLLHRHHLLGHLLPVQLFHHGQRSLGLPPP